MNIHIHGIDVLGWSEAPITIDGATIPLAQAGGPQPAIVIRVKNAGALAAQGGAAGSLAFEAVPNTITNIIYGRMRDEFLQKFKEKGVDADVSITTTPPAGPPPRSDFVPGVLAGGALVGLAWGAAKLFGRR